MSPLPSAPLVNADAPPFGPFDAMNAPPTAAELRVVHVALLAIAFSLGAVIGWVAVLSKFILEGRL